MKKSVLFILTVLALVLCCACFGAMAEEAGVTTPSPTPTLEPLVTPGPERLAGLQFIVDGPDARMPMTVSYGDLVDGKLQIEGLAVGTYTVTEVQPEALLEDYTFDAENSVTTMTFEVKAGENTTASLKNVYATATPTATPAPETTPTPTPEPIQLINVPVTKVWADNDNADGNRPGSVTVYLSANGTVTDTAVLDAGSGWSHTFADLPAADAEGNEIAYTVSEEKVPMYESSVSGYTITNTYVPETTELFVEKVWNDENNKYGIRPKTLYMRLSNGQVAVVSEENGWKASVTVPAILNGQPVTYSWTEQESLGYELESVATSGTTTVFVNKVRERPQTQREDAPPRKGNTYLIIDEYGTPLGVNVVVNHVGDCFE